jgi:hypothetical protein
MQQQNGSESLYEREVAGAYSKFCGGNSGNSVESCVQIADLAGGLPTDSGPRAPPGCGCRRKRSPPRAGLNTAAVPLIHRPHPGAPGPAAGRRPDPGA